MSFSSMDAVTSHALNSAVASCARTFNDATVELSAFTKVRTLCPSFTIQSFTASSLDMIAIAVADNERKVTNAGVWTIVSGSGPGICESSHAKSSRYATQLGQLTATCLRTSGAVDFGSIPSAYPPSGGGSSLPCSHASVKRRTASVFASVEQVGVRRIRTTHSQPAVRCMTVLTTAGLVVGSSHSLASNDAAASLAVMELRMHRSSANLSALSSTIRGQSSGSLASTASKPAAAPCAAGSSANFGEHTVTAASTAPAVTTSSLRAPLCAMACDHSFANDSVLSIKTGPLPLFPFLAMSTSPPMFCANPKLESCRGQRGYQRCGVCREGNRIGGRTWVSAK